MGIDSVAGPSEILIIADGSVPAEWIAWDLLSQAEHDEHAQAILLSTNKEYLAAVDMALDANLEKMPRAAIARESLKHRGALVLVADLQTACEISNRVAPEHLELAVKDSEELLPLIRNAGAIFFGANAPEAFGDYCAGPNHVLPTSQAARYASPLGVYEFQKRTSLIRCSDQGAAFLAPIAGALADAEGLGAHAASARARLQKR